MKPNLSLQNQTSMDWMTNVTHAGLLCSGLLFIMAFFSGCGQTSQVANAAPPAIPVTVMSVSRQPYTDSAEFMAQVNSKHATEIHPQVSSRIVKIFVTDGQLVKSGQPLYQLDVSQQAASVNSLAAARH